MTCLNNRNNFQNAVFQVLEAVMFENWLRFYFYYRKAGRARRAGRRGAAFLAVPEKGMERIKELYPHLLPLAEDMNAGKWILKPPAGPCARSCWTTLDGKSLPKDMTSTIF